MHPAWLKRVYVVVVMEVHHIPHSPRHFKKVRCGATVFLPLGKCAAVEALQPDQSHVARLTRDPGMAHPATRAEVGTFAPPLPFLLFSPHTTFLAWPAGVGDFSVWHAPGCSPPPRQLAAATWYSPAELTLWLKICKRTPCQHADYQVARLGSYGNLALKPRAQCCWTAPRGRVQPAQWMRTARNTADTEIGIPQRHSFTGKTSLLCRESSAKTNKNKQVGAHPGSGSWNSTPRPLEGSGDSPISSLQCTSKSGEYIAD